MKTKSLVATFGGDRIEVRELKSGAVIVCNNHYWTGRTWVTDVSLAKAYVSIRSASSAISRQSLMDQLLAAAKRKGIF